MFFSEDRILYEDNHILIVNKLPGELVQKDKKNDISLEDLLKIFLKYKYNKPGNAFLGVIHRIDRPVSGALIFAKTSKALVKLNEMNKNHQIKKVYIALTKNFTLNNTSGTLKNYLIKDSKLNISKIFNSPIKGAKEAILYYNVKKYKDIYVWKITLETGRHHQIRAQLGAINCPIILDKKYGYQTNKITKKIYLHSFNIEFIHPIKKENINIIAPFPKDKLWNKVNFFLKSSNNF